MLASLVVDSLKRVELEVILLIEPAALEELQRQSGSSGKSEGIDRQLHVRVLFLSCVWLVIKDVDIAVADLQELDVTRDNRTFEVDVKPALSVIGDVLAREKDGSLHGNCHGIIDQHEPLQCFVPFLVVR